MGTMWNLLCAPHTAAFSRCCCWRGTGHNFAADEGLIRQAERALWVMSSFRSPPALGAGIRAADPAVRRVLHEVPRHRFVPDEQRRHAYKTGPRRSVTARPISQPLIVAVMTEMLRIGPVTAYSNSAPASGYQAAVLAAPVPKSTAGDHPRTG